MNDNMKMNCDMNTEARTSLRDTLLMSALVTFGPLMTLTVFLVSAAL